MDENSIDAASCSRGRLLTTGCLLLESRARASHGIMRAGLERGEVGFYRYRRAGQPDARDRIGRHASPASRVLLKERDESDDR